MPPQPISATLGRSFGLVTELVASAAANWRSKNQTGKPLAAAASVARRRKERRETWKEVFMRGRWLPQPGAASKSGLRRVG